MKSIDDPSVSKNARRRPGACECRIAPTDRERVVSEDINIVEGRVFHILERWS